MEKMTPNRAMAVKVLVNNGFRCGMTGFSMLETLLTDVLDDKISIGNNIVMCKIYSYLADRDGTLATRVERNIRCAIDASTGKYSAYANKEAITRLIYEVRMAQASV